jgi:hypothetical protein
VRSCTVANSDPRRTHQEPRPGNARLHSSSSRSGDQGSKQNSCIRRDAGFHNPICSCSQSPRKPARPRSRTRSDRLLHACTLATALEYPGTPTIDHPLNVSGPRCATAARSHAIFSKRIFAIYPKRFCRKGTPPIALGRPRMRAACPLISSGPSSQGGDLSPCAVLHLDPVIALAAAIGAEAML